MYKVRIFGWSSISVLLLMSVSSLYGVQFTADMSVMRSTVWIKKKMAKK